MKFGIAFANTTRFTGREGLVELAQVAEAVGFESLWTVEHVIFPDAYESQYPYDPSGKMVMAPDTDLPDPLIWLTWVAAVTERIHLGTGILILPQRNSLVLAKELGTLDALSGGRVELGIGVGWLKEEFEALGIPFAGRGRRTDEYVGAMRALWEGDHASYDGETVSFSGASINPKPPRGRVPIHIGGHTETSARRAGRLGDGYFPGKGDLPTLVDIVRQTAADAGRDPEAIEITAGSAEVMGEDPVGAVQELAAIGVDRVVVPSFIFLRSPADDLAAFAEKAITPTADL
ncbi:MAG TPA: LLM class F420-dependent oxidoreductase [Iamia sp.]|jgi:probable F420-dependent oxidoreductase|nr:LLM class F420-dependent oxidoreductase [Iamia sp.]